MVAWVGGTATEHEGARWGDRRWEPSDTRRCWWPGSGSLLKVIELCTFSG